MKPNFGAEPTTVRHRLNPRVSADNDFQREWHPLSEQCRLKMTALYRETDVFTLWLDSGDKELATLKHPLI